MPTPIDPTRPADWQAVPFVGDAPDRLAHAILAMACMTGELARHALLADQYSLSVGKALAWLVYVGEMTHATQASMATFASGTIMPEQIQAEFDAWLRLYNLAQGTWPNTEIPNTPIDLLTTLQALIQATSIVTDLVAPD